MNERLSTRAYRRRLLITRLSLGLVTIILFWAISYLWFTTDYGNDIPCTTVEDEFVCVYNVKRVKEVTDVDGSLYKIVYLKPEHNKGLSIEYQVKGNISVKTNTNYGVNVITSTLYNEDDEPLITQGVYSSVLGITSKYVITSEGDAVLQAKGIDNFNEKVNSMTVDEAFSAMITYNSDVQKDNYVATRIRALNIILVLYIIIFLMHTFYVVDKKCKLREAEMLINTGFDKENL